MNVLRHLGEQVAELALELQEIAIASPHTRDVDAAAAYLMLAAEKLLELDPSPELAAEVLALQALCLCGRDRGDHLAEPPHASEDGTCEAFAPVRERLDTLPDLMTEPAPPPLEIA
jgi:hypothetical protein